MKYFTDVDTEDELTEQYRKLLIKYDYRSAKNQKIIEEIEKEYKIALKRIPIEGKNVPEFVKAASRSLNAAAQKQQAEEDRKKALKTKSYTKEDLNKYINERKMFIRQSLIEIMKDASTYRYLKSYMLQDSITDSAIFNAYTLRLGEIHGSWAKDFHNIEEKTEYAVFYLTGRNEKNTEAVLRKLDSQMGAYIKSIFPQLEEKYVDPVLVRKSIKANQPTVGKAIDRLTFKLIIKFIVFSPVIFALIFVCGLASLNGISDGIMAIMMCIPLLLIYFAIYTLVRRWWKKNEDARDRVRTEDRRRAMTNLQRFVRVILKMMGFRIP